MKKFSTLIFAILASSLIVPESADAATSNFQGNCSRGSGTAPNINLNCVFDAQRPSSNPSSCSPSSINQYFWDLGDSSAFGFLSYQPHVYLPPLECNFNVVLTVFCDNADFAVKRRDVSLCIGGFGAINVGSGWQ